MTPARALTWLAFIFAAPSAFAAVPPLSLSMGVDADVVTRRAYDWVDTNDHRPSLRLGIGYVRPLSQGALDLDLGYSGGQTQAEAHQSFPSKLVLQGVQLGASYRYALHPRLEPFARIFVGWDWASLSLETPERLSQTQSGLCGGGMLGVSVPLLRREKSGRDASRLSLDLGVGYTARPKFHFDALKPDKRDSLPDDGVDSIPNRGVDLGTLPLSAPLYRVGFSFRL